MPFFAFSNAHKSGKERRDFEKNEKLLGRFQENSIRPLTRKTLAKILGMKSEDFEKNFANYITKGTL